MHLPITYILKHLTFAYNHTWISSLGQKKSIIHFKSEYPIRCYKLYTFSSERQNKDSVLKYRNKITECIIYTTKANY